MTLPLDLKKKWRRVKKKRKKRGRNRFKILKIKGTPIKGRKRATSWWHYQLSEH